MGSEVHFFWAETSSLVGILTLASSSSQVGRATVYEVEVTEISTDSASGEEARATYASCMERVIVWVVEIGSSVWEIENSAAAEGKVSEVQTERLLRRTLEAAWFCQKPEVQLEAKRTAVER